MAKQLILVCLAFVSMWNLNEAAQSELVYKTCLTTKGFRYTFNETFSACKSECERRRRCKGIMYSRPLANCVLYPEYTDFAKLEDKAPTCLYSDRNAKWTFTGLNNCQNFIYSNCADNQRCVEVPDFPGMLKCENSECMEPPEVANAAIVAAEYAIGTTNLYRCLPGFSAVEETSITCKNDATWTDVAFNCQPFCPRPSLAYSNADMVSARGRFTVGTTVDYQCIDGYTGNGLTTTIRCNADGTWTPNAVYCCLGDVNDNLLFVTRKDACFTVTMQGGFGGRTEMVDYCLGQGGEMGNAYTNLRKDIIDQTGRTDIDNVWFNKTRQELEDSCDDPSDCWYADDMANDPLSYECVVSKFNVSFNLDAVNCTDTTNAASSAFVCRFPVPYVLSEG